MEKKTKYELTTLNLKIAQKERIRELADRFELNLSIITRRALDLGLKQLDQQARDSVILGA